MTPTAPDAPAPEALAPASGTHRGEPANTEPPSLAVPAACPPLVLRGREFSVPVVMAIVNRTDDSFYAGARQWEFGAALEAAHQALAEGAAIVDIGGVRAGVGPQVTIAEEVRRVVPFVAAIREQIPDLLISVDTWRAEVAAQAIAAGADLINDTWAGFDPEVAQVAGAHGVGLVCSHTGGATPRTDPFRVAYPMPSGRAGAPATLPDAATAIATHLTDPRDGVVHDVVNTLCTQAHRAVELGVPAAGVLIDPTHDFGKNTWHSLHLVRRTQALTALGFPVLMALSRKDFVGETLGLAPEDRLEGTLAATAVAAWLGARVFRTHDVRATRRVLDMVAAIRDEAAPVSVFRAVM